MLEKLSKEPHVLIIYLMINLGYEDVSGDGICFGIAHMAMQAILARDILGFNERIQRLCTMPSQALDYDLMAFFDGIQIYQDDCPNVFPLMKKHCQVARSINLMQMLSPNKLDLEGGIARVVTLTGVYTKQQLFYYLQSFADSMDVELKQIMPTAIVLGLKKHAVTLSYDSINRHWLVIDANSLPAWVTEDVNELVELIFDEEKESLAIYSLIYCSSENISYLLPVINSWRSQFKWKNIHSVVSDSNRLSVSQYLSWLHVAIRADDNTTIKELLSLNIKMPANVNEVVHIAIQCNNPFVLEQLFKHGPDYGLLTWRGIHPLYFAASTGSLDCMTLLLERGATIDEVSELETKGKSSLDKIIDGIKLEQNSHHSRLDIFWRWLQGVTRPHRAQLKNYPDTTRLRVSAIHASFQHGNSIDVLRLLIDSGIDVNAAAVPNGVTALHIAASEGHLESLKLLLERGALPNIKAANGRTSLHTATDYNKATSVVKAAIVVALLKAGAEIDLCDRQGMSPLHYAARLGDFTIAKILIYFGADINKKTKNDITPLMIAAMNGCYEIAELIVQAGANIDLQDTHNRTAYLIAYGRGHYKVATLLFCFGANTQNSVQSQRTQYTSNTYLSQLNFSFFSSPRTNVLSSSSQTPLLANEQIESESKMAHFG